MQVHYFQHVHNEDPGSILDWAESRGHQVSGTRFDLGQKPPSPVEFDMLVVMGGPMSVNDETELPWLVQEKRVILDAIQSRCLVVGICLGSQLIANALGARVYAGKSPEIGWFPVTLTEPARDSRLFGGLPREMTVLHWHGETFDLPPGAVQMARSEACENQAFAFGDHVVGLQFHFEMKRSGLTSLVEENQPELTGNGFVQSPERLLSEPDETMTRTASQLSQLLDHFVSPT